MPKLALFAALTVLAGAGVAAAQPAYVLTKSLPLALSSTT
jgi:hypothetical protein